VFAVVFCFFWEFVIDFRMFYDLILLGVIMFSSDSSGVREVLLSVVSGCEWMSMRVILFLYLVGLLYLFISVFGIFIDGGTFGGSIVLVSFVLFVIRLFVVSKLTFCLMK